MEVKFKTGDRDMIGWYVVEVDAAGRPSGGEFGPYGNEDDAQLIKNVLERHI